MYVLLPVLAISMLTPLPIVSRAQNIIRTTHLSVPTCEEAQLFLWENMKTPRVPEGGNASFQTTKLYDDGQTPVMLKIIPGEILTDQQLARLMSISRHLNETPFISPYFYGACKTDSHVYLCTEYLTGQDLFQQLEAQRTFPEYQTKKIISEILQIVSNLHHQNIIHRDIKLENFMFAYADDSDLRIIDFDDARLIDNEGRSMSPYTGSQSYRAPECDSELHTYDEKADIYSIGLLFLEMLLGNRRNKDNISETSLGNLNARARDFAEKMVSEVAEERWSADELLNHPYLNNIEEKETSTLQRFCEMCHVTAFLKFRHQSRRTVRTHSM